MTGQVEDIDPPLVNAMISGLSRNALYSQAWYLYHKMQNANCQFDDVTYSTNSPIKQSTHSRINNGGRPNVDRLRNLRIHSPGRKSDFSSTYALGATLGKGTFSRVVLAQHRSTFRMLKNIFMKY